MLIGIDLGTTNSCAAVLRDGEPVVIPNAEGRLFTPSLVATTPRAIVGADAAARIGRKPLSVVGSAKRLLGTSAAEVAGLRSSLPYAVTADQQGRSVISLTSTKRLSPVEVQAMLLSKLKADAEAYLGETVDGAVITVPAYFNDDQRQATKDAGRVAGLDVKRIINEPTAASLAYGLDKADGVTVLIVDVGGGGMSVSLVEISDGIFEVKATSGSGHLGGDDWDGAIVGWLASEIQQEHGVDLTKDKPSFRQLFAMASAAKVALSTARSTRLEHEFAVRGSAEPLAVARTLTRKKLDVLTESLVGGLDVPITQVLRDAEAIGVDGVDRVIMLGAMTRMPAVRRRIADVTGHRPSDGAGLGTVAMGAAVQAGVLSGEIRDALLLDVSPFTIGIETKGGVMTKLIERNTTIPTRKGEVFSTAEDNQPSVEIHVLQGEREMAAYNKSLGKFQLTGIPPAPRGIPQIEVDFLVDVDGMLDITAKDLGTGDQQRVTMAVGVGLSEAEIKKMVRRLRWRANQPSDSPLEDPVATGSAKSGVPRRPDRPSPKAKAARNPPRSPAASASVPESRPVEPRRPEGRDHPMRPIKVFVSYSHKDTEFLGSLQETLAILQSQGLLDAWHDGLIGPGKDWQAEIAANIGTADLILMLVSRPFLASPFCREEEMRVALERHEAGEARVIPLLIRPSDWQNTGLKHLQALPSEGRPVSKWADQDDAWQDVTDALRQVLKELQA